MNTAVTTPRFVLRADKGEGKAVPLALAGMPTQIEGRPVHYRRKEIAHVGSFVHRGTGKAVSITRQMMQTWVAAFKRRVAKGLKPPILDTHTLAPRASDTYGYVVGLSVEGDRLYADLQLIGDDALTLTARNDISLCAVTDALDAEGNRYAEIIHHCALTPDAAHPGLGGYVKIAASAGGSPVDVPLYTPAAAPLPKRSKPMLTPEQMQKLRQKLSLSAEVPDEQVMDVAAEHVVAAIEVQDQARESAAQVTALSAQVKSLKSELSTANEKVTMLSADAPKELDPRTLTLMRKTFRTARDEAVASGVISEAGMAKIDKLLGVDQPNGLALSLSAGDGEGDDDMLYSKLCEIIAAHPGIKTNAAVQRSRAGNLSLSANRESGEVSDDRRKELLKETPLGQAALAGAK